MDQHERISSFIIQTRESLAELLINKIAAATPNVVKLITEERPDTLSEVDALLELHRLATDIQCSMNPSHQLRYRNLRWQIDDAYRIVKERRS